MYSLLLLSLARSIARPSSASASAGGPSSAQALLGRPSASSSSFLRFASTTTSSPPPNRAETAGHVPTTTNPTEFEAISASRRRGAVAGRQPRRLPTTPSPKELPDPHSYLRAIVATVGLGAASWVAFLAFVTNGEKSSSSVFRQVMFVMRTSELVERTLGEAIVLEKTWWTGGEPWVSGSISVLKGRADLSFRLRGARNSGRVYFTSIRPTTTSAFHVIRFKLILDDPILGREKGEEVDLRAEMQGKGYDLESEDVPIVLGALLGAAGQADGGAKLELEQGERRLV